MLQVLGLYSYVTNVIHLIGLILCELPYGPFGLLLWLLMNAQGRKYEV